MFVTLQVRDGIYRGEVISGNISTGGDFFGGESWSMDLQGLELVFESVDGFSERNRVTGEGWRCEFCGKVNIEQADDDTIDFGRSSHLLMEESS